MVVLDSSVVNVALPAIRRGLGFGAQDLTWVVNAYLLVFAGGLLLGGRVSDVWGVRRASLAGLAGFMAGSVAGGLAPTAPLLVAARAVQAAGAAVLMPAGLALLTATFPDGPARRRALALWAAVASAGGAAGSLLGGSLTAWLGWRSTLLVNGPVGAVLAGLAVRATAGPAPARRRLPLDVPGASAATLGVGSLTFGLVSGSERGWSDPVTTAALAAAAVLLAALVWTETRWSPEPLLPLALLRRPGIALGNLLMVVEGACLMPMWYFLSLYMQQGLGLDALHAGLGFLPHTVLTVLFGAWVTPRLMDRVPNRTLVVLGSLVCAGGFLLQSHVSAGATYLSSVAPAAVVIAVGGSLVNTPLTSVALSGAEPTEHGAASGLMNTAKQVGGVLGLAGLVTLTAGVDAAGRPHVLTDTAAAFTAMSATSTVVAVVALLLPRDPPTSADRGPEDEAVDGGRPTGRGAVRPPHLNRQRRRGETGVGPP